MASDIQLFGYARVLWVLLCEMREEAQVKAEEMPVDALKLANKMADDWGWDANDIGRFELAKSHTEFAEQYARKFAAEQLREAVRLLRGYASTHKEAIAVISARAAELENDGGQE